MNLPLEQVVVGGYRIERKLGSGGQGQVYLGWREGRAYALKFIHLGQVEDWGWRELFILLRHQWPNVVRLVSHWRWPEDTPIDDAEPLMLADILSCQPLPAHEMNERVPRALSDVCMRLLEKKPEARWASTGALCAALEAALKEAEGDAGWDVPLCLGWGEEDDAPEATGPGRVPLPSWADRWTKEKPRRGKRPAPVVQPPALPPVEPVPVPSAGPALVSSDLRRADVLAALGKAAALVALLVLVGLGAERLLQRPSPVPAPAPASGQHLAPGESSGKLPAQAGGDGGEMAREEKPPEADRAAAPPQTDTPPAAKDDASVKTPRKTPSPDKKPTGRALRAACAGLTGQALQACVAAQQTVAPVVYSAPPALECPAGAVRTMEDTLDIDLADKAQINFAMTGSSRRVDVRQSATILLGYGGMGKLKAGTVLSGKLFFTADSVYGLFTEARTEDGTTYPVCLELYDVGDSTVPNRIGAPREDVGGPADSAVIFSSLNVRAVRQFPGKP